MNFSYAGIVLDQLVRLIRRSSEAIYDGPTYLYTQHMIHVMGRFNPDATSYNALGLPQPGNIAALTDAAVRHTLMQNRQQLIITLDEDDLPGGEFVWISSPLEGYTTDAANGPIPHHVDVTQLLGAIHMDVEIIIEVNINECVSVSHGGTEVVADHIVLANLWEVADDMDNNFRTTRTVTGRMTLRTDAAISEDILPDDFRQALFFPVMTNCQRRNIRVTATDDGRQVFYTYTDAEKMTGLTVQALQTCPGLTRVEASHTAEIGKPGIDDLMRPVFQSLARGATRGFRVAGAGFLAFIPAGIVAAAVSAADVALTIAQLVPREVHTVVCRAYGQRGEFKKNLESVALRFCTARMNLTAAGVSLVNTAHLTVNYLWEDEENVVEVTMRCKQGFAAAAFATFFAFVGGAVQALATGNAQLVIAPFENRFTTLNNNIMPGEGLDNPVFSRPDQPWGTQPVPPNSGGTRGTLIERMVTQALQTPCALPAPPQLGGAVSPGATGHAVLS